MEYSLELPKLDFPESMAVVLAGITGLIHFYLAPQIGVNPLGISFLIAGIGFTALIGSIIFDYRRNLAYLLGIPFTLGQIVIWYYLNKPQIGSLIRGEPLLDAVDKIAQIILLTLLIYLYHK